MSSEIRRTRVSFVVVKLSVGRDSFLLLRQDPKWKDLNFIGGHEASRDSGDLGRTARRELREEVPPIRGYSRVHLEPLTPIIEYGPVKSASRGDITIYEVQFFSLKIDSSPMPLVETLSKRGKNVWVTEGELKKGKPFRVSSFVRVLDKNFPGGLEALPYSSAVDLSPFRAQFDEADGRQLQFALK